VFKFTAALTFILATAVSSTVLADNAFVAAKLGMWQFTTENITATSESDSGFGAYALEAGYSFTPKTQLVAAFNILLSDGFGGQTGFGFDLGGKYYPITDALSSITRSDDVTVKITENFRPYIGAFFKQRTFNFILSTTFVGGGLNVGFDYSISNNWFLNAELRYDMLFGPDEGEATQTNILVGAGLEF